MRLTTRFGMLRAFRRRLIGAAMVLTVSAMMTSSASAQFYPGDGSGAYGYSPNLSAYGSRIGDTGYGLGGYGPDFGPYGYGTGIGIGADYYDDFENGYGYGGYNDRYDDFGGLDRGYGRPRGYEHPPGGLNSFVNYGGSLYTNDWYDGSSFDDWYGGRADVYDELD